MDYKRARSATHATAEPVNQGAFCETRKGFVMFFSSNEMKLVAVHRYVDSEGIAVDYELWDIWEWSGSLFRIGVYLTDGPLAHEYFSVHIQTRSFEVRT